MTAIEAYEELITRSREVAHLDSAMELAYWDQRTNMPDKGHAHRVRHLAAMEKMRHRRFTDSRIDTLLSVVENSAMVKNPSSVEYANIREWRRIYNRLKRIPLKLATELVHACSEAESIWEKACLENDWPHFKPILEKVVSLKQEEAQALGFDSEPYDSLLEVYEPGETAGSINLLFDTLTPTLLKLIERINRSHSESKCALLSMALPVMQQKDFATNLARRLGYSLDKSRIDISSHPFASGLGPGDVRITSRFNEQDLREGLFGVVHEVGHAFYMQRLPLKHWGEPVCRAASLGMDESQSLIWEFFVARSKGFWDYFYNEVQTAFPYLGSIPKEDFYLWINEVNPAFLRVNADEVTYDLHILLRFKMERALINNELEVADLPVAWNELSRNYLGHIPPDWRRGVMQDVHWSAGLFGYFPSYTLGHIYAAQLYAQAEKELGDLKEQFSRGDFSPLRRWLGKNIHFHGAKFVSRQLIRRVTGVDPNPKSLMNYLETKYGSLYKC
jgi:carboxypeptidase Taq